MTDRDIEEPEEDAVEQRQIVPDEAAIVPDDEEADPADLDDDPLAGVPAETPLDVDAADAVEQSLTVEIDDDEYR